VTGSAASTLLEPGTWTLDPAMSTATFIAHQLGRAISGSIPIRRASADIGLKCEIRGAHIDLDIAVISTGIEKRDFDLAKPRLLNTEEFPTLSVEMGIAQLGSDGWHAQGIMSVRGIKFPVDLVIAVEDAGASGIVQVRITTVFDRKPIGIRAPNFVIGKNIEVEVHAVFKHEIEFRA
jgi:polyisoprenoid-binding protein YceI